MTLHDTISGAVRRVHSTSIRARAGGRRGLACALLATAIAASAGCAISDDGPQTTRTLELAPFTRVDNPTSVDVRLHVGAPQRVRVTAGKKVIGDVGAEVHDGTLHVTYDHHSQGVIDHDVIIDATVPKLTGIDASGSGDVDAEGIRALTFDIRSHGSAPVTLRGRAQQLAVALSGSGDAHLAAMTARHARVTVSGSGGVDVRATKQLDVSIDGSGDVHYHGHPATLTKQIDGSGDLSSAG